jgi:hypothetical protein
MKRFMDGLIDEIIEIEWKQFQKVNDQNNRASCQNNWDAFYKFRKNQFSAWNKELLESYLTDCRKAEASSRNLLKEKYARMMESTAPEEFSIIKETLPPISNSKKELIEKIIKITIYWAEEFAKDYPVLAKKGRPIHAFNDNFHTTSIETYSRGEISTYSLRTIKLYYAFQCQLMKQNINLTKIVMTNTVKDYGYESLEEAEENIVGKD